ncbi:MAG: anti-sigma factor [Pseudomonas sp.]|uniref:anti-sigma factor n=1 Tax=Pseudomonas abieticivorans TaxID=2931382 RepID=UPI0020BDE748|nr:anti-sigma factor [Pseudomonas sp. PIA16]MDE1167026.1 anti-sigma factor [Pseudomonas sp.]
MNYQNPTLRRALAADYAIGLMPASARRRFEKLMLDDRALRLELAQWQDTLASLHEPIADQPVPEHVWQAVVARIEPQQLHVPAKRPFWNWLRVGALAASIAVAVTLGVVYNQDSARYSATLVTASNQPSIKIQAYAQYLQVEPVDLPAAPADSSMELWAIPANGKPVSLGLMPEGGKGRISLNESQQKLLGEPIALAVSLEPRGGSPTGQPTGPVLLHGNVVVL